MDKIGSKNGEKCRRRSKATRPICRETGDHVHYPPTRQTRPARPPHAPSPILKPTRKARYGECRKNQAAGIGTTAYDGCGEFVTAASGEDSLDCAACGCHRSFHRQDSVSDDVSETVLEMLKLSSFKFRQIFCSPYGEGKKRIGKDNGDLAAEEEEKEEEEGRVKRFKTKFTAEQTEKMRNYAEKLRWRVSSEIREEVDEFCVEIGVDRKRFKIWMNNHKNTRPNTSTGRL